MAVAPHVGAWIETLRVGQLQTCIHVAPHAGAWIETLTRAAEDSRLIVSLPTRERGLKQSCLCLLHGGNRVAPHAGAWIETVRAIFKSRSESSLPTWERGLKLIMSNGSSFTLKSLPTWERGLKLLILPIWLLHNSVAPHVGAWIETIAGDYQFHFL